MRDDYFNLFQRQNGYYYYYVYDKFGRRVFRSTGEKRKGKAFEIALSRAKDGELLEPKVSKHIKFGDYAKDFWNYDTCPIIQQELARNGHYSRKHAQDYYSGCNRVLIPSFGKYYLEEITSAQIQSWLLNLPEKLSISNKTANDHFFNLRNIFKAAFLAGFVEKNPCENVQQLVNKGTPHGTFTKEQIRELFKDKWQNYPCYVACMLAAKTGMRLSEIRALTVEQLKDNYIDVNASWAEYGEGRKTTKAGYDRIVAVQPELIHMLQEIAPNNTGLIFTLNGVTPVSLNYIPDRLKERMEQLKMPNVDNQGLKLSFHSFRFFFNSRLVVANFDGEKIRATIGHEDAKMTKHYCHLKPEDLEQVRLIQREIC